MTAPVIFTSSSKWHVYTYSNGNRSGSCVILDVPNISVTTVRYHHPLRFGSPKDKQYMCKNKQKNTNGVKNVHKYLPQLGGFRLNITRAPQSCHYFLHLFQCHSDSHCDRVTQLRYETAPFNGRHTGQDNEITLPSFILSPHLLPASSLHPCVFPSVIILLFLFLHLSVWKMFSLDEISKLLQMTRYSSKW